MCDRYSLDDSSKPRGTRLDRISACERSGLPQSTISSWYKKGMTPSFLSLEKILRRLGLTLSQFFADGQERLALTDDQRRLLDAWALLTAPQKDALLLLMQTMY